MSEFLEACPLCHCSELPQLYCARDPHYGIPGNYRIVKCTTCSLIFLNPLPSDRELACLYPSDYYAYHDAPRVGNWKKRLKTLLGYWDGPREPRFVRPGTFLDVGCGAGEFLEAMSRQGWDSYGVEPNIMAADLGRLKGRRIFGGALQDAKFPSEFFDYIRASHSLEHSAKPVELLAEVVRVLKPQGTFMIAVPNANSIVARFFGRYWWHLCPPVHPVSYSVETLRALLSKHSLRLQNLSFNSDYVGIIGSVQIWLNRKSGACSSEGFVFGCRPLRLLSVWAERICDVLGQGDMIEATAVRESEL